MLHVLSQSKVRIEAVGLQWSVPQSMSQTHSANEKGRNMYTTSGVPLAKHAT